MIKRNCIGKIQPTLGRFFVQKENGKYKIAKKEAYSVTDAWLYVEGYWFDIEPFDSMVRAYKYLKDNINNLI